MHWYSEEPDAASFKRTALKDPDFAFVRNLRTKEHLTLSGALEKSQQLVVRGYAEEWRVHVIKDGRKLEIQETRLPKRVKTRLPK